MSFVELDENFDRAKSVDSALPSFEEIRIYPVQGRPRGLYRCYGKRALEITLILIAALPILMVLLPLAVAVALDGGSPFYSQMRVGRHGRLYRMWKLRSMVPGAEAMLEAHLAENPRARAEWDATQKLRNDPRVTRVGRLLRKTSLDELPQLWNVLRGEMSLVGPRPMLNEQRILYPGRDYYGLKPGITGLWQVSSRNESEFAERARFDTQYNRELSLRTDLRVIAATVGVVCRGTGH